LPVIAKVSYHFSGHFLGVVFCIFSLYKYGTFVKSDGNIFQNEDFSVTLAKNVV